ncbi:MAG: hypothetical protein A3D31_07825 [Candidatus Fluviicola riflensis]|nr:MAG: hypothetical protein CHH17_07185 [Candidatus Fluviicola riflensis]OGS79851.1 MAG: hypothetical protein A3D31_07825 [Candidatus Fluviicola riflensis]OGS82366.1 MAG: hypothetical protein A2724_16770 [Fluviicola sp. RIFCSPHIGHO2_01_FULL_43_53]OGS88030.1 MAG: hypothetical protein A3E30_14205 [Fluviicola sp. RIFCSPHIGHO2_12_FULL_43_24]
MKMRKKIRRPIKSSKKDEHKPFLGVQAKTLLNEQKSESNNHQIAGTDKANTNSEQVANSGRITPKKQIKMQQKGDKDDKNAATSQSDEKGDKVMELSESQVGDAISYNTKRFKNPEEIKVLRKVLGLSAESSEIDEVLVKTIAEWQVLKGLIEDGKVGPKTAASIGYEMLEKSKIDPSLKSSAIKMLERGIVISFSGNSYTDSATESRKNIKFNVTVPKGLKREDYALVNWVKGYMKQGNGRYFTAVLYGSTVTANYGSYQVDSLDPDPIYWSEPGARWTYNKEGSTKFTATDSPGPALSTETGADYNLNFKLQVYRLSDIPATTSGNLGGAESKAIATVFWKYKVKVSATGKFSH